MMRGRGQRFLQILVLEARRHAIYLRSRKAELLHFPPPGGNGMPHFGGDLTCLVPTEFEIRRDFQPCRR